MIYRITITRVLRSTQWLVTLQSQSVAWGIGCLTLERARKRALEHVPAHAQYTITYDTPRGIHDIGPFVK